jgi:hypothetical protein
MENGTNNNLGVIFYLMDLPINANELDLIVKSLGFGGDAALYHKLKLVRDLINENQDYKKILREQYGMVI